MKRHRSLHPLSEHHHHVLVQALLVRRAAGEPAAKRASALRVTARNFLRFWRNKGSRHFREEEEVLLPAYARHARLEEIPSVALMLAQHAVIRARMDDLEKALAKKGSVEAEVQALAQLLHDHVRLEENEIFPAIEAALSEDELRALAPRITRLHGGRSRKSG
ncbi:MAG: hemerythrin domain-containing protein [Candidatus Acidiferrales bacterium]